jgi:hypothetical protein
MTTETTMKVWNLLLVLVLLLLLLLLPLLQVQRASR